MTLETEPTTAMPDPLPVVTEPISSNISKRKIQGETVAKVGTILSAILASSCCWLPLLLLAVGVSGAGIATALAAYRPLFIGITVLFLGAAFYFTYRPKRVHGSSCCASQPAVDCCGHPIAVAEDCCAGAAPRQRAFSMMAVNKVMLWAVTVMAVFFLFFPGYVSSWLGSSEDVITGDMRRVLLRVDGMTCEGCAPTAAQALKKANGVLAVKVSYAQRQATVGTDPDEPLDRKSILASLEAIGYRGRFIEDPANGK